MNIINLIRQVNIEDLIELTPIKGSIIKKIFINKPPQLEEIDNKISELIDYLNSLEETIENIDQEYFQDIIIDPEIKINEIEKDIEWENLHKEYENEINERDEEYLKIIKQYKN